MTGRNGNDDEVILIDIIGKAFCHRRLPSSPVNDGRYSEEFWDETGAFWGKDWMEIPPELFAQHMYAMSFFPREAFAYYLPGLMTSAIKTRSDELADSIAGLLFSTDQPADADGGSRFFEDRWTRLTQDELDAVLLWLDWLETKFPDWFVFDEVGAARRSLISLRQKLARSSDGV